jgi:glycosyltransferase involved in cell wall biosynthesis
MIKYLFSNLFNRLNTAKAIAKDYPVIFNANGADESNYSKRALLIYLVKPFLLRADDPEFLKHQNLTRCRQIASILGELGYIVDVGNRHNLAPLKHRKYSLIITDRADLRGVDAFSGRGAINIFLATSDNYIVHNRALRRRHELLFKRRGRRIQLRRIYREELPFISKSDAIIGVGNEYIMSTWKEVFKGPIYPFNNYGFKETRFLFDSKDFSIARENFLFFASRCQIQKGLDLLLEIFPKHPDLHLYICSQFEKEEDFCACYHKELYQTPNIHPIGWVTVNGPEYNELVRKCAYVIHPTCSEGQAGSVVQCMYSGLIPLVTREEGIDTEDFGITFSDDSLEEIEKVILEVSHLPERWHRERSIRTREVSEEKYSEDAFMDRWRNMLAEILSGAGKSRLFNNGEPQ